MGSEPKGRALQLVSHVACGPSLFKKERARVYPKENINITGYDTMETEKTVALVVRKGGKFLLLKRANRTGRGLWCIPGGHAETGETAEKAALREAREEIGEVLLGKFILKFVHDVRIGHRHEAHIFFARLKAKVKINEESSAYGWFTTKEMKGIKLTDYTLYVFNYMIEKKLI